MLPKKGIILWADGEKKLFENFNRFWTNDSCFWEEIFSNFLIKELN